MELVPKVLSAIKSKYGPDKRGMDMYLRNWHQINKDEFDNEIENFAVITDGNWGTDFELTLNNMSSDILLKIAIEMGVDTPGFIPTFPTFKNELKSDYNTAYESFEKAVKSIGENPDLAVGLANSTLESIVKHILEDQNFKSKPKGGLETLMKVVLKEFSMSSNGKDKEITEINKIASSLINISQNIEGIRSAKTSLHGKVKDDYILNDSLYAYFIVNSVTTVGMFLKSFYEAKYKKVEAVHKGV